MAVVVVFVFNLYICVYFILVNNYQFECLHVSQVISAAII